MPWLRLWVDVLDDPDLYELPEGTCWGWVLMLGAAKRFDCGGDLPPLKTLAHWLRKPEEKVARWIAELTKAGMIETHKGVTSVHGWERWQGIRDWTNSARQAKHRAKQKALRGSPSPLDSSPPPQEIDRGGEKRNNALRNAVTPVTVTPLLPIPTAAASEVSSFKEENQDYWREALNVLRTRGSTAALADQIEASRDSEVSDMDGWRALVASHAIQKPNKAKTLQFWIKCGKVANGADLEAIENPRRKPEPGDNGSLRNGKHPPKPKAEPELPPDRDELVAQIAALEDVDHPAEWQIVLMRKLRNDLATLERS